MSSKRWIFQGNSLRNWQRPVTPPFVILRRFGNGLLDLPRRRKGKKS